MIKRNAIVILVVILTLGILSSFAMADSTIPPELQAEADKAGVNTEGLTISEIKTKITEALKNSLENQAVINPEISDRAQKAGIDTTGLNSPEAKIKLLEAWNGEFRVKAQKYGIDVTNLSDEQVREQVLTIENADAIAKAKKAGINTDGLTYSLVMAAIEAWDRENARSKFGINTDGMTYSQVIEAVQEKAREMAKLKEESVNNRYNSTDEQLMADLIISAKALGIQYEGLSYDELYKKIIEAKKANINNN